MEALIIFIIMSVLSIVACSWCARNQRRTEAKFNKPTRKMKKQAKVVQMKMEKGLSKSLDIKLSPSDEVIKQMDEAIAATSSFN